MRAKAVSNVSVISGVAAIRSKRATINAAACRTGQIMPALRDPATGPRAARRGNGPRHGTMVT
jgi:hypothetical protein